MSKLPMKPDIDAEAHRILDAWLSRIHQTNLDFRSEVGPLKFNALDLASHLLAAPRSVRRMLEGRSRQTRPVLQCAWMPYWPALKSSPLHNSDDFVWTTALRQASSDIRNELLEVLTSFERARYDSEFNAKPWHTYYFSLHGRPDVAHLAACPRTSEVLQQVPHNGFHVCFSAFEPGGSLHPHTGPTNGSLTAHLGLLNCAGTSLWVGGEKGRYLDDEVLVFDDCFVHWVDNAGTNRRYTLMIIFWHPELTVLERELLRLVVRIGVRA